MDNIVSLADRRDAQHEGDPPAICGCGSWWFELRNKDPRAPEHGAVCLRRDGSISGYTGVPHCVRCGAAYGA